MKGLVRAQLALALRLALVVVTGLGALPLLFAVAPAVGAVKVLGVNLPWLLLGVLSFPFLVGRGLGVRALGGTQRAGLRRGDPQARVVNPYVVPGLLLVVLVTVGHRRVRAAVRPHHLGLPGRLPLGQPGLERRRDQRRVPVRRVLPGRRRPGPAVRRRRALVPGRVRRRLPGPAAVRGRPAAPLGRVHPARLLPGAAAVGRGCAGWPPSSWSSSAASTWCRSCRARA